MIKACEECGKLFEAKRSTARFCSSNCRLKAHRAGHPLIPDLPQQPERSASFDDVANAVSDARRVSNTFSQLAFTAPRKLQPGCGRISEAITKAIENEEW